MRRFSAGFEESFWWRSMKLGMDLQPLRSLPTYRRLFFASGVTNLGSQATYVTVAFQMSQLTHSVLAVGAIGLVEFLPLIVFGLYGGVLADAVNRKTMLIATEVALLGCSVALLLNSLLDAPSVILLYVVIGAQVIAAGLQSPSLDSLRQQVVPHESQAAATTLSMFQRTVASIAGPALGGLLAVSVGCWSVYGLDCVSFLGSLVLLARVVAPARVAEATVVSFSALWSGVRYAVTRRDLLGTYLIDLSAMLLAYPLAMLPFVAQQFHQRFALALLYAALPLGALGASLTSRWSTKVHHYGQAIALAAGGWGLGIALFGWSSSLWIAVLGLVIAGWTDAISAIFRGTMWNQSIPTDVRGRMAGIELLSYSVGPTLGQSRSGIMAAVFTLKTSLIAGGLLCTGACAGLAAALPSMWRFDARTDANVALVKAAQMVPDEDA
jgi:MFS family permease